MRLSRNRHLRPNPQTLGVTLLEPGEASRPVRIRAKLEVFNRLSTMTPTEIGALLESALPTPRNAPSKHFTRKEALKLQGQKVRFLTTTSPQERKGSQARVINSRPVSHGEGFELELNTGMIVTKSRFELDLELLEG